MPAPRTVYFTGGKEVNEAEVTTSGVVISLPRVALLQTPEEIRAVLESLRTIAVLGIKPEPPTAPAYYVPEYARDAGIRVIPVPVYFPDATEILGERVYRKLADVPDPIDAVIVFRRPNDVPEHLDDMLAARPRVVWMQLGIRNDAVAERLSDAGIDVVQNRCLMVDLQRNGFERGPLP
jgi:predicted CoA-binding protein